MSLAMHSDWAEGPDAGGTSSWRGTLASLGERDASIAVRNNDQQLEITFMTTDPGLQERIMNQGIFVWFDPGGREARMFGVRYPLAWSEMPLQIDAVPDPGGTLRKTGLGMPGDDLEIYTDGYKEYERISKNDARGIDVHVSTMNDTLLYQLTVPLKGHDRGSYSLNAAPGDLLGIGIETRDTRTTGRTAGAMIPFKVWRNIQLARRPSP